MNLNIGDRIKDNDKRMYGRVLVIETINPTHVYARDTRTTSRRLYGIQIKRIHMDGKGRRYGFNWIGVRGVLA